MGSCLQFRCVADQDNRPFGLLYLNSLDWYISNRRVVWQFLLSCFMEILISNEDIVDPDQTPDLVLHYLPMSLYAASNLGLHCLPMSLLWNSRHKWGNRNWSRDSSNNSDCLILDLIKSVVFIFSTTISNFWCMFQQRPYVRNLNITKSCFLILFKFNGPHDS